MGAVFAMQGFGQMTGALVMLFLTLGFKESLLTAKAPVNCTGVCALAVDKMWRALIGMTPGLSSWRHEANKACQASVPFLHALPSTTVSLSPKPLDIPSMLPVTLRRLRMMSRLISLASMRVFQTLLPRQPLSASPKQH